MRPRGEHFAQDLGHTLGLLFNLLFAEPDDLEAPRPELEVTGSIVAKCLAASMEAIAIGLHRESAIAPEEVDQV